MDDVNMQCVLQKVIQHQLVQLCHDIDGEQSSTPCWGIKPSLVGGLCPQGESQMFFSSKVIWDFFQVHVSHDSSTKQSTCKGGLVGPFFSLHFQDNIKNLSVDDSSNGASARLQLLDHVTKWLKLSSKKDIAEDSDRDAWGEGTKMFWFTNAMFRGACFSANTGGLASKDIQPWNFSMSETREEGTAGAIKFLCTANEEIKESLESTRQKITDIQNEMAALYKKRQRTRAQDTHQDGFGLEEGQDVIKQYFDFQDQLGVLDQAVRDTKKQGMLNSNPDQSKKHNASLQKLDHAVDKWLICIRQLVMQKGCSEDVQTFWANYSELCHQREQEASLKEKKRMNTKCLNSLRKENPEGLGYDLFWQQGFLFVGLNVSERIAGLNLNEFSQSKYEPSCSDGVVSVPPWIQTYRQMIAILSRMKQDDKFYAALSFDYYFLEGRKVSDCKLHLAFTGYKDGFWKKNKPWSKMFLIDLLSQKCFAELSSKKDRMEDSESFGYAIRNPFRTGVSKPWKGRWNQLIKQCLTKVGTRGVMRCERDALFDLMRKQQNVSPASPFLEKYVYERCGQDVPMGLIRKSIGDKQQDASPFLEKYVFERGSDYQNPGRTLFDSERVKGKKQRPVKCYGFAFSD